MESEMTKSWIFIVLLVCLGNPAVASAQARSDPPRGELLYSTHCIACHNAKIHWRDKKVAKDWASLKVEVRRWQGVAGLAWTDKDIVEVTRYLNTLHYHFPEHVQ
jgi:mono/diheme cytochrome c family protein